MTHSDPGRSGQMAFDGYDIASWLVDLAQRRGAHPFLIWSPFEGEPNVLSYSEFLERVRHLAGGLQRAGVGVGDRVLVHLDNCPETLLVRFACAWIGAVCVATNSGASSDELSFFAESSAATCAITQERFLSLVNTACPLMRWIAVTDAAGMEQSESRYKAFSELYGEPADLRPADPCAEASVLYTTGSTARPKGVVWTHANVLWGARLNAQQQGLSPEDVHLLFLPLFHVVGLSWAFFSTMWVGGTVVLQPRFSKSRFWPVAQMYRATVSSHVNFTTTVLAQQTVPQHFFRTWVTARYDRTQEQKFGVSMVAGWGMTELVTQVVVASPYAPTVHGGIGRPSLGYVVRIENDMRVLVRSGEAGHLVVRGVPGLSIFKCYEGDPGSTETAFDEDGFFMTGDRVRLFEDGSISFEDRLKDVIKVGGENVSALEVEQFIAKLPGVREVAVVARPHSVYGETVVAFVVPADRNSTHSLPTSVAAACAGGLARFKVPAAIRVIDELPRIGVGKVAKTTLREIAKADVGDAMPQGIRIPTSALDA